ncbi:hypothetical protein SDC9_35763 [bioreactor metagenome]|uniref:DUF262 domain-containing protein n=1 Tax=bioreactor metagenome TaxID=1076179 RepID=A0A644VEK9_9ZZZZ
MSISATQRENIGSILNGNLFVIPSYQRKYSWTNKEQVELWTDIKGAKSNNINHFFGTLIFKKTENDNLDEVYEIIDGQQRTTTLFLLLNELIEKIVDTTKKMSYKSKFISTNNSIKLLPLGRDKVFLEKLILDFNSIKISEIDKRSQKNLLNAKKNFQSLLNDFNEDEAISYIDFIRKNVEVLVLVVDKQSEAIRMFEIINDRGLELNYLDKIKSITMLYSTMYLNESLNDFINESFEKIFDSNDNIITKREKFKILSRFDENETLFLHHYIKAKIFFTNSWNYRNGAKTIFESLKSKCEELKENKEELEKFLKGYIEDFTNFSINYSELIDNIDNTTNIKYIESLQFLEFSATMYPLIVILYSQNKLDSLIDILISIEIRVFKIKGTNPRADIPTLCNELSTQELDIDYIKNWLVNFRDKFMNNGNFEYSLKNPIYGSNAVKYILLKYINQSIKFIEYENLQIEHIFAKETNFEVTDFNFDDIEDYKQVINKIGNLLLLEEGLNKGKDVSNLVPKQKIYGYLKSNISNTREFAGYIEKNGFDKNKLEDRNQKIISFCLENL